MFTSRSQLLSPSNLFLLTSGFKLGSSNALDFSHTLQASSQRKCSRACFPVRASKFRIHQLQALAAPGLGPTQERDRHRQWNFFLKSAIQVAKVVSLIPVRRTCNLNVSLRLERGVTKTQNTPSPAHLGDQQLRACTNAG